MKSESTADYLAYTVELKDTHEVIGSVGCSYYKDMEKVGIVYFVGREYRNHGYAAEAAKAYVRYFLQQYEQDEIIATIREDNVPSWRTIEKAGFRLTEKKCIRILTMRQSKCIGFTVIENKAEFHPHHRK